MNPQKPAIPVSIIGGFLGAGKTSFLNRLLCSENSPRSTVLVNDFGDIAIDEALIAKHGGDTIALKNGCVCCSIGNDLSLSLAKVLDAIPPPERIIIEASGVSNPVRIMDVARISNELYADGIIVIVDTLAIFEQLEDRWVADTVNMQLSSADIMVLSKLNQVDKKLESEILHYLNENYAGTPVLSNFDQSSKILSEFTADTDKLTGANEPHFHFATRSIVSNAPVNRDRLEHWLKNRNDVYRMKGWVHLDDGSINLLQVVGRHISWTPADDNSNEKTQVVLIGRQTLPDSQSIITAIARKVEDSI